MTCAQIEPCLDAMMDGELDAERMKAVEAHCEQCVACAEKLKLNRQMMRMFAEMAPEMDVPLKAQAAWRGAVKAEAQRASRRRRLRIAGGIAAALVVAVGATFALNAPSGHDAPMAAMGAMEVAEEYAVSDSALIEADGATVDMSAYARKGVAAMHEVEMVVEDLDAACEYVGDLVAEYEGSADIQRFDADGVPCANLYIELPAEYAGEFLQAAGHYDTSGAQISADGFAGEGDISMLLVLRSE